VLLAAGLGCSPVDKGVSIGLFLYGDNMPVDRDKFLDENASRFPISWISRTRLHEVLDAIEQETRAEWDRGERDLEVITPRVTARVKTRGSSGGEFGGIIATIAIAILSQLIAAYIKKLIDKWLNP
jgi:hypothetical protein